MAIATEYEIEHSCGHEVGRDLSQVPAGERAGKAAWWSTKPCFDCFKKSEKGGSSLSAETLKAREKEGEDAAAFASQFELPELVGSNKQIPWALTVRHALLNSVYTEQVAEGEMSESEFESTILQPARIVDHARWWIDNKDAAVEDVAELLADSGVASGATTENPN